MTPEQALIILQNLILNNTTHQFYQRAVDHAKLYKQLITGEEQESLLIQFVRREDPEMFAQRKALTQSITPAVAEAIMNPFYRIGRLENAKKIIDYPLNSGGSDQRVAEIQDLLSSFYGEESIDKYLGTRFVQLSFTDPNAWIIVEFDAFDPRFEKAKPYPLEFSSSEAVDFSIRNNKTEYLIIRKQIWQKVGGAVKEGYQYIMYLKNDILQYTQILTEQKPEGIIWNPKGEANRRFLFQHFTPKGGEVQAVRVGYKGDTFTEGKIFVNPFHAAVPYFKKTIKAVSELDLTSALHVFPQKLQYVEPCGGTLDDTCNGGTNMAGNKCKACQGSGIQVHKTAQDMITLPMPDLKKTDGKYMDLGDILIYKSPPVELLRFQDEFIEKLEAKAIKAVYNSDVLSKKSIAQTATERIENKDELYNTLQPFAEGYSTTWKKFTRLVAAFTDNGQGLRLVHEFPSDFKLKTVNELIDDLKLAKDSGASAFVIQEIEKDIAAKLYADDDTAFNKFLVKTRFTPFLGKTAEEVIFIISSGKARKEDEVLWSHSDTIFDELEVEVRDFFKMTYQKQEPLVMKKVATILEGLNGGGVAIDFRGVVGTEDEQPSDLQAESQARLKGSVGGVQGILQIQASVASGVTQYAAGLALLESIYGYDDAKARAILGTEKTFAEVEVEPQTV